MAQQLKDLVRQLVDHDDNWKLSLLKNWHTIVGDLSNKMAIVKIYNDSLTVGVYDSCWLQELYLLSPTILHLINQTLDQPRLKQLRFKRIGTRKKAARVTQKKVKIVEPITYTLSKKEQITLQNIKDSELREQLEKFLIRCHREGAHEEGSTTNITSVSNKPINRYKKKS